MPCSLWPSLAIVTSELPTLVFYEEHPEYYFHWALEIHTIINQYFKKAPSWGNEKGFSHNWSFKASVWADTHRVCEGRPRHATAPCEPWNCELSHLAKSIRVTQTEPQTRQTGISPKFLASIASFSRQRWVKGTTFQKQKGITTHCS